MLRLLFATLFLLGTGAALMPQGAFAQSDETKVLALGIANRAVTEEELSKGDKLPAPHFNTPAVAYVLAANVKKGDSVEITLKNGDTPLLHNKQELTEDQASFLLQAGKTGVPAGGWPEGTYSATVEITRDGKVLLNDSTKPVAFD